MIGSEDEVAGRAEFDSGLLLYDYFKHVTTLALVALGGVLGIVQGSPDARRGSLLVIVVLIGIGGGAALSGLNEIVKARTTGQPARSMRWYRLASGGGLAMGVGAFLAFFLKDLR